MDLVIRRMNKNDLEPLHELLSNPQVMRYLEPPFTKEQTALFLKEAGLAEPPLVYSVDEDHTFVGYVIYHDYDENSMEIGWVLHPNYWGKGYASCLTKKLIALSASSEKQLLIECDPEQAVTKHLAIKHGFEYEGKIDGLDVYRLKR